ncbi:MULTISPECIES: acyl-CoA dehydrogenase family protein [unclassified Acinetobacter]|uniref:acyl-CoA dehydrogenase family protein n=1 Tax=unclassified Acinetobacter TaxID=196816 RepID=UPI00190AF6D8|nr:MULTISPECIES: acyl-CoA dehydrogenase family protein [unclassified Acinetobacter]MBK0062876.1 acyl-CoA dehydrogenase family protein [Acinetobacter sp. S55]MBK0065547.1 acyl-CoA dehydrogenase family protein [Acinetobacter sp. S54]
MVSLNVIYQLEADNNIPDRHGQNFFNQDPVFRKLLQIYLPNELYQHLLPHLEQLGADVGGDLDSLALSADKNPPTLQYRNRRGFNEQKVRKHPDYIALEKKAYIDLGLASMSHKKGILGWPEVMPPMAKYALTYLFVQAEFGLCCPVSMTDSLTHTMCKYAAPEIIEKYLPNLLTSDFDHLTQGAMFMTEQGAGSDVSGITTLATQKEGEWFLTGDKWFCSNPDAGLAMVLAHVEGAPQGMKGLGLFLMPKFLDNGCHNHYQILRLKDKLGTRSMASGEISLQGAKAYLLGEIGRGFQQMADMINLSRLSNGVRAAGLMRRAVGEALYICQNRQAFGQYLQDLPLQRKQLLKMMLPSEQARTMMLHTARLLHASKAGDEQAASCVRILTPLIKFRACRDARKVTGDAMEVRGGCGYIEEWSDPRILRDAHLGSIWEGTSNIVALDVIRAAQRAKALAALKPYLLQLLKDQNIPEMSRQLLTQKLEQVEVLINSIINEKNEADTRKAASALYHITTAIMMAWESVQIEKHWQRLAWAHLVVKFKLSAIDPLQADHTHQHENVESLLIQHSELKLEQAMSILN